MEDLTANSAVIDVLFVAAGTDYRAYESLRRLKDWNIEIKQLFVINFSERGRLVFDAGVQDSYFQFRELATGPVTEIIASFEDPASLFQEVAEIPLLSQTDLRIGLDISCFTKPFFFGLLKLFQTRLSIRTVRVFYTEPRSYVFHGGLYDAYHASSGPTTITELPSFVGRTTRDTERLLVLQLGFEGDLAHEINEDVAPNRTILINGFPGLFPKFKDISLVNNERLVGAESNKRRYSRANNPFDSYNVLEEISCSTQEDVFINVAPLGTKPMALGACLFALHNPNVRIIYPKPETYALEMTLECSHSWSYNIPLLLEKPI